MTKWGLISVKQSATALGSVMSNSCRVFGMIRIPGKASPWARALNSEPSSPPAPVTKIFLIPAILGLKISLKIPSLDGVQPVEMGDIPLYGFLQTLFEGGFRPPTQPLEFSGVGGIPPIVTPPVFDELNQGFRFI